MNLEMDPFFYNKFLKRFNQNDGLYNGEEGFCHHLCVFLLYNEESPWRNAGTAEDAMQAALNLEEWQQTEMVRWARVRCSLTSNRPTLPPATYEINAHTCYYVHIRFKDNSSNHAACVLVGEDNECVIFDPNWGFEYIKVYNMEIDHAICLFLTRTCKLIKGAAPSFEFYFGRLL